MKPASTDIIEPGNVIIRRASDAPLLTDEMVKSFLYDEVPNAITRAAMREADELAGRPAYTSVKAFMAALKKKKKK